MTGSGWLPLIVPQCRCFPEAVAHRRISTASLVGGREEVSLLPGKDRRAPTCRSWLHALRVSLVSVIAPPHARSPFRGTVPVIRIFFCQGASPAPLNDFHIRAWAVHAAYQPFQFVIMARDYVKQPLLSDLRYTVHQIHLHLLHRSDQFIELHGNFRGQFSCRNVDP